MANEILKDCVALYYVTIFCYVFASILFSWIICIRGRQDDPDYYLMVLIIESKLIQLLSQESKRSW